MTPEGEHITRLIINDPNALEHFAGKLLDPQYVLDGIYLNGFPKSFSWSQLLFLLAEVKVVAPGFPDLLRDMYKSINEEPETTTSLLAGPRCPKIFELLDGDLKPIMNRNIRFYKQHAFTKADKKLNPDLDLPEALARLPKVSM